MFKIMIIAGVIVLLICAIFQIAKIKPISNFTNKFLKMKNTENQFQQNESKNNNTLPNNLDIYNEIVGLRNQISFTNFWLFLICIMFFIRFILPIILIIMGLTNISNELQSIFQ